MERFNQDKWKYFDYDTSKYNFKELLCELFGRDDLENMHDSVNYPELFNMKTEQSTVYHKKFYDKMGEKFLPVYTKFIKEVIKPYFNNQEIVFQKVPTFRTQFLNNISVGKWHRDKDYSHSTKEVNFYMSITDSINTNAVWAESEPNKKDYKPLNAKYGEVIAWDGANCKHGNKENTEGFTRVSFDFRAMPLSDYEEKERLNKKTVHAKMQMVIGQYYEVL